MNKNTLGEQLAALRKSRGMTQQQAGEAMGLTGKTAQMTVGRLETGGREAKLSTIETLARALNARIEITPAGVSVRGMEEG